MSQKQAKAQRRATRLAAGAMNLMAESVLATAESRIQTAAVLRARPRWCPSWLYHLAQRLVLEPRWRVNPGEPPRDAA